jgi:hypothetical protein
MTGSSHPKGESSVHGVVRQMSDWRSNCKSWMPKMLIYSLDTDYMDYWTTQDVDLPKFENVQNIYTIVDVKLGV